MMKTDAAYSTFIQILMDSSRDGIAVINQRHEVIEANSTFGEMLGYSAGELLSLHTWDFDAIMSEQQIRKNFNDLTRTSTIFETMHRRKDGSTFEVEVCATGALVDDQPLVLTIIRDISSRKQAQRELQQNEQKYRLLANNVTDVIWMLDLNFKTIFVTPSVKKHFGYTPEESIALPLTAKVTGESYQKIAEVFAEALRTLQASGPEANSAYVFEIDMIHRDGRTIPTEVNSSLILDEQGAPIGIIGSTRNISEQKKAQEEVRVASERFRSVFEQTAVGVVQASMDGYLLDANDKFCEIIGYERPEIIGRHTSEFTHPEDANIALPYIAKMLNGEIDSFEIGKRYLHKNRQPVWTKLYCNAVRDIDGKVQNAIAVIADISHEKKEGLERKKLQEQLNQAQRLESIGRLAGGIAHDYNNMLGVIMGYTELALQKTTPDSSLHADLVEIQAAAKRSADITRQLLAFSRKQAISPKAFDLNETVAGMLKMLRRMIGENITLTWTPGAGLWTVFLDPSQLDQILANLCVNARDAIADVGQIAIQTRNCNISPNLIDSNADYLPGDYVMIAVSDNGCGIASDIRHNIFEPFFTTKPLGKGTGLGLATVYGIVKQNNGFIDLDSEPGKGTTIRIYLPRHHAEEKNTEKMASQYPTARGNETILLVEDEQMILRMTEKMLQRLGYQVLSANDPATAIDIAKAHQGQINLLMTDVIMPGMNGKELSAKLRSHFPELKVLFMSGYTADVIVHRGVLEEDINFLQKPFSIADLATGLRHILEE